MDTVKVGFPISLQLFGVFQGSNHSGFPMIAAMGALGMRVLVTYLFRYSAFLGHTVIWWNGIFGFGMGFLITWTYYLSGRWQRGSNLSNQTMKAEVVS